MNKIDSKQLKELLTEALTEFKIELKKDFATKDDLASFATKDDLASFATKDDLASFATKKDLQLGLDDLLADIVDAVDKHKANKQDLEQLEKRVDKLEEQIIQ